MRAVFRSLCRSARGAQVDEALARRRLESRQTAAPVGLPAIVRNRSSADIASAVAAKGILAKLRRPRARD